MAVLDQLRPKFGDAVTRGTGMAEVRWPARGQWLSNGALLDVAHNASSVESLVADLQKRFPGKKWRVMLGLAGDKDAPGILRLLAPIVGELHLVPLPHHRAASTDELAISAESVKLAVPIMQYESVADGLAALGDGQERLITGSLYLAGEVLRQVEGDVPAPMI
jgi:dihydrofolate synthase/folylpolyglutamate synthase